MIKACVATALLAVAALQPSMAQDDTLRVHGIKEVVVTGTRNRTDIRHLPMTLSVIGRSQLTDAYRQSILPTLSEQVPGLFVTDRGLLGYGMSTNSAGSIKVRGIGGGADLLVLIDGLPQYAGLYGHPIADACQTMLAERVEVLRGPASLLYGSNAMGGVVNIVTRRMDTDGMKTNMQRLVGSYGTIEGTATNRYRNGRFSSIVGINYGRTDAHRRNMSFEQYAGFAKLGYDLNANWNASGSVNITYIESSNPGEVTNPYIDNDMKITRGTAAISLTNEYRRTSGAVRAFYNWGHHNINDGYHPGGTPQTRLYLHDDLMGGVSAYQSASIFNGNRITLGFDYQHLGGEAWYRAIADGKRTDIADRKEDEFAGYIDVRQDVASFVTVDAGLRIDYNSMTGTELVPQGGLMFRLPHTAVIRAMVSKGFRNPTVKEMYMFVPANPLLEPERMMNYELSYKQHFLDNRLSVGVNVFYIDADNMIAIEKVNGKNLNVNTGELKNSGVELEAACQVSDNIRLNANYSLLHMKNPVIAAPEHKLYVGGDYTLGRLSVNTGVQYVAGLYTAVGANEQKENFVIWNLTVGYRVTKRLRLFVNGDNLLAQKYEINKGFPMPRATFMGGVDWEL